MSLKEKIMEGMMGNMSPEEKEAMMSQMMESFFKNMSGEDRQKIMEKMMEKFMGSMSQEEKQKIFENMIPEMMKRLSREGPMSMMSSMMKGMMSREGKNPMEMCKKMMSGIEKTLELSIYSTSELHNIFEEWLSQIEDEVMAKIKEKGKVDTGILAEEFKLGKESIEFIVLRLARKGKIVLNVEPL